MARLIKYNSFEALKLDTKLNEANSVDSVERHIAFEKFINLLQTELRKKQPDNHDKSSKKHT